MCAMDDLAGSEEWLGQACKASVKYLLTRDLDHDLFDITAIGKTVWPPRIVNAPHPGPQFGRAAFLIDTTASAHLQQQLDAVGKHAGTGLAAPGFMAGANDIVGPQERYRARRQGSVECRTTGGARFERTEVSRGHSIPIVGPVALDHVICRENGKAAIAQPC